MDDRSLDILIALVRELRIGTSAGSLIPDAVLLLQFGGAPSERAVPWTKVPSEGASVHAYAIESDRATEPHSTIAGKSRLYSQLSGYEARQRWGERFRSDLPTPFWIANTVQRAETLKQIWLQAWPDGTWMVAAVEQIAGGTATRVGEGRSSNIFLYDAPRRNASNEPKATLVPLAPPGQASTPPAVPQQSDPASVAARPPAIESPPARSSPPTGETAAERPRSAAKPGPSQPSSSREAPTIAPSYQARPLSDAYWTSGHRPTLIPAYELDPLPAFPKWLRPRSYHSALVNGLCIIGLMCWLPLWFPLMLVERTLYGLLVLDELLATYFGRLRAMSVWLTVAALLVGWCAINVSVARRRAAEEASLPRAWYVDTPASATATPAAAEPTVPACVRAVVTVNRVNLRMAPSLGAEKAPPHLNAGDRLDVCGEAIPVAV